MEVFNITDLQNYSLTNTFTFEEEATSLVLLKVIFI